MPVKPIPYGIADYKCIIENGYAYVDKTMYIRTLERAGVYHIFLRPRRFGKSLFASMLGCYYDIAKKIILISYFPIWILGRIKPKREMDIMS